MRVVAAESFIPHPAQPGFRAAPRPHLVRRLACAAALWAALVPWAAGACKIGLIGELSVDTAYNRVVTTGQINGKPVRIAVDTGTSFSFIWQGAAPRLGLSVRQLEHVHIYGIGGEAAPMQTDVKHLRMGTFYANDMRMVVLGGKKELPPGAPDLVLGDDFFSHFDTEFDLAHGKIRLLRIEGCRYDQTPYWAKTFSLAEIEGWDPRHPYIEAKVRVNGKTVEAIFDSGAPTSAITRSAAERAGVTPWLKNPHPTGSMIGVGGAKTDSWVGTFDTFSVGDETVRHVPLRIADLFSADTRVNLGSHISREIEGVPTMLIGCDFFLAHRMLVLSREHKIVFTYNGGPIFQTIRSAEAHGK